MLLHTPVYPYIPLHPPDTYACPYIPLHNPSYPDMPPHALAPVRARPLHAAVRPAWLRTNAVNTNGAAAKVMIFDRLGKKVDNELTGVPKKSLCQKT